MEKQREREPRRGEERPRSDRGHPGDHYGDTRTVTIDDATSLTLGIERPDADRAVARLGLGGRAFRLVATRETGGDGEPATWRAEAVELPGAGGGAEHALGWEDANVGFASADAALEETARRVAAVVGRDRRR
jgi:hypothetical protein